MTEGVLQQDTQRPGKALQRCARKGREVRDLTGLVIDDHFTANRPKWVSRKATNSRALRNSSPLSGSPVPDLIRPTRYGPAKPPRLPIELIAAIDTAALERLRKSPGSDQKGDLNAYRPASAAQMSSSEGTGLRVRPVAAKVHAANSSGRAEWSCRSRVLSEWIDQRIIATVATAYGTMAISPTSKFVVR